MVSGKTTIISSAKSYLFIKNSVLQQSEALNFYTKVIFYLKMALSVGLGRMARSTF